MKLLAIDTATQQMGVAVTDGDSILSSYELLAEHPHGAELPGAVARVLKAAGLTLNALEGLVVDLGPGSFTGLRIGLAFVKALAFATKKPVVGVSSLDVLAAGVPFAPQPVCPILDARQTNVYAALFRLEAGVPKRESDYWLGRTDEVLSCVTEPTIFLGDGCARYRERIVQQCPGAQFAPPETWWPKSAILARLGRQRFQDGQPDDPAHLVPLYLYPLDCSVRSPDRPTSIIAPIQRPVL